VVHISQMNVIMIGDSVRLDIEPARKVGMHTILVNTKKLYSIRIKTREKGLFLLKVMI